MTLPRIGERANAEPIASPVGVQPPIADFSTSVVGNVATFTNLSIDPDGTIVSYRWDFGDVGTKPTAQFTLSTAGLRVILADTSFDTPPGSVVSWLWNFGDGGTSTERNPVHDYLAGGTYTISLTVTDNDANQSTPSLATITLSPGGLGPPFGLFDAFGTSYNVYRPGNDYFTMSIDPDSPEGIILRIDAARTAGKQIILFPTSGQHSRYISNGKFDPALWTARLQLFNQPDIVAAVKLARQQGVVLAINILDEPQSTSWAVPAGPSGITRAMLDSMASQVKALFGSQMPVMCSVTPDYRTNDGPYTVLDLINPQFVQAWEVNGHQIAAGYAGTVQGWRDWSLALAATSNVKVVFSLNILNGGSLVSGVTSCPIPPTGGYSPIAGATSANPRCSVGTGSTGAYPGGQLFFYTTELMKPDSLGRRGVGLTLWTYNTEYVTKPVNQTAFGNIRSTLATYPAGGWLKGT